MKKRILFILLVFEIGFIPAFSQWSCNSAVNLTVNPDSSCVSLTFVKDDTLNGSSSDVLPLGCGITSASHDWWGTFTANSVFTAVKLNPDSLHTGHTGTGIIVYSGPCGVNMNLVGCSYLYNQDIYAGVVVPTVPGQVYYVRIHNPDIHQGSNLCVFDYVYPDPFPFQGECNNNLGFEYGNFTNWKGMTGICCPISMTKTGIQSHGINAPLCYEYFGTKEPSQHTIMTDIYFDPISDLTIPGVCPGTGNYSVRLGNANIASNSECLETSFTVDSNNIGLTYYYAIVLQDPNHTISDQPRFYVELKDENGDTIPCAQYYVVSGVGTGNWKKSRAVYKTTYYKNWVPVGLYLKPYIGQKLTLRICSGDCGEGGHFGYAYFDMICRPLKSQGFTMCSLNEPLEICAPPGYTNWLWSPGGYTTECITVSNPQEGDVYTLNMTTVTGCSVELKNTIALFTGSAYGDTTICPGQTVTLHAISNDPATYLWTSNPPGFVSDNQDITITPSDSGIYTYTVKIISLKDTGCMTMDQVTVNVIDCTLGVDVTATSSEICKGGCTDLKAVPLLSPIPPYTIEWDHGLPDGEGPYTVCPAMNTTYRVTITDAKGFAAFDSITITVNPLPVVATSSTNINCFGICDGKALANVSGGTPEYKYNWSDSETSNPATALCAGVCSLTVTDAKNCTATGTVTITQPAQLTLTSALTDAMCGKCDGIATVIPAGGIKPYTYNWDSHTNSQTTQSAVKLCMGIYPVTVTDKNSCTQTTTVTINTTFPPTLFINPVHVNCFGNSDGSINLSVTDGTPTYIIKWSNGFTDEDLHKLPAGNYSVTVTDSKTCSSTQTVIITQPEKLNVTIPVVNKICISQSVILSADGSGGTPDYTYQWNDLSPGQTLTVSPSLNTDYSVLLTDTKGCTATAKQTVDVYPPLDIKAATADNSLCPGECTNIVVNVTGGDGTPYVLKLQDNTVIKSSFKVCPQVTTTYTITADDNCTKPTVSSDVTIYALSQPPVNFTSDISEGCIPLKVQFHETSPDSVNTYIWNFGASGKNPAHLFLHSGKYDITCEVLSTGGCKNSLTIKQMIIAYPNPDASFLVHPQVTTIRNPLVQFENTSGSLFLSLWQFGDGDSSTITHPEHIYKQPGIFKVKLYVESKHGCPDYTETDVIIQDIFSFFAPDAFTPGNDLINEVFSPMGKGIDPQHYCLRIFDRWGEMVFETNKYGVDENGKIMYGWDGRIKGKEMGNNTIYFWLCIYTDLNGIEHTKSGTVMLIR